MTQITATGESEEYVTFYDQSSSGSVEPTRGASNYELALRCDGSWRVAFRTHKLLKSVTVEGETVPVDQPYGYSCDYYVDARVYTLDSARELFAQEVRLAALARNIHPDRDSDIKYCLRDRWGYWHFFIDRPEVISTHHPDQT